MGVSSSEFDRVGLSHATWLIPHAESLSSPLAQFALSRYGVGISATGVASNAAMPQLLRRRMQDWSVRGCSVHLGADFVSFGRELESISQSGARLFYGVDISFGEHSSSSWLWYCRAQEWLLRLHKVVLEELPVAPTATPVAATHRWGGQPHWLGSSPPEGLRGRTSAEGSDGGRAEDASRGEGQGGDGASSAEAQRSEAVSSQAGDVASHMVAEAACVVTHQIVLVLGNADGHPGLLVLPVPAEHRAAAEGVVARWAQFESPLCWSDSHFRTAEDFQRLRETALIITDLYLLGLEPDLAMALTPDWTWEKYPRGLGEVAFLEPPVDGDSEAQADA